MGFLFLENLLIWDICWIKLICYVDKINYEFLAFNKD